MVANRTEQCRRKDSSIFPPPLSFWHTQITSRSGLAFHPSPAPPPHRSTSPTFSFWSFVFPGEWVHAGGKGDLNLCSVFVSVCWPECCCVLCHSLSTYYFLIGWQVSVKIARWHSLQSFPLFSMKFYGLGDVHINFVMRNVYPNELKCPSACIRLGLKDYFVGAQPQWLVAPKCNWHCWS